MQPKVVPTWQALSPQVTYPGRSSPGVEGSSSRTGTPTLPPAPALSAEPAAPGTAPIDWSTLLFFAGLFVVVHALAVNRAPNALFERVPLDGGGNGLWGWMRLSAVFLVGSNIVSIAPFILVMLCEHCTFALLRTPWRPAETS